MPKKLLMNNKINDGTIVLCKDFSPNGQQFILWENQMIDWDKYELYINVDVTNITNQQWQHILAISIDNVSAWSGTKLHLYGSIGDRLRIDCVYRGAYTTCDINISEFDKNHIKIVINKDGVYLYNNLQFDFNRNSYTKSTLQSLKSNPNIIGSAIITNPPVCTYNLVQLQPYQERGE